MREEERKMKRLNIAMDGPVGAGKSSIADAVAARLGILHLDTGAMYRALGLKALRENLDVQDEERIVALCETLNLDVRVGSNGQETLLDGEGKEAGALTVETNESGRIAGMTLAFPLPTYIDTGDGDILADLKAAHDAGAQRGEEMFLVLFDAIAATDSRVAARRDSALEKLRQTMAAGKATAQAAYSWRFGFSLEPGMFEGTVTIRFTLVK